MATYQGPQKPGYGFTPGGGSAPVKSPTPKVVNPKTGREWDSPESYVNDPKKYGGGGGSSGSSFNEEFARLQAKQAAEKAAEEAQKAADLKAKNQADAKARQDLIDKQAIQQGKITQAQLDQIYQQKQLNAINNILNTSSNQQVAEARLKQIGYTNLDEAKQVKNQLENKPNIQSGGGGGSSVREIKGAKIEGTSDNTIQGSVIYKESGQFPEVQTQPYIRIDTVMIGNIPEKRYTYIDPTGIGVQKERPATDEEINFARIPITALSLETGTASSKTVPITQPIIDVYNIIKQDVSEGIVNPILQYQKDIGDVFAEGTTSLLKDINIKGLPTTIIEAEQNAGETSNYLKSIHINQDIINTGEFITGVGLGNLRQIREEPLKYGVAYGSGLVFGAAFEGGSLALGAIPKIGKYLSPTFNIAATGFGGYMGYEFLKNMDKELQQTTSPLEAGELFGVEITELALMGLGFTKGQKSFDVALGRLITKGPLINIPQGVYPEAPKSQHLSLFEKNYIEGLSYKSLNKLDIAKEYAEFNLKNQLSLKDSSIYPQQHAYPHLKQVAINTQKIIDVYPEFDKYLIKEYGSLTNAKIELSKGGFLHDLLKVQSSSNKEYFGMSHGDIFYELYRTGNLPEGIKINPKVAKAIKLHEITSPKNPSVEFQILATADRLNFDRFSQRVNEDLLPLRDVVQRLQGINKEYKLPEINFDKDTSNFLKKYKIVNGQIVPVEAKPVAIHTTSSRIKGTINPAEDIGKSEFIKSFYVGTKVSTEFAELSGSNKGEFDFERILQKLLQPKTIPGIAVLEPKGFREVNYKLSKNPLSEKQRPVKGRYAYLLKEPEIGIIDIPRMKTEIEGLARTPFELKQPKVGYVEIEGVRVSLDKFKYVDEQLNKNLDNLYKNINKIPEQRFNVAKENKQAFNRLKKEYTLEQKQKNKPTEKEITFDEMSSTGRDFIRKITRTQAEHEVAMLELTMGKVTKAQRELLIERRYDKLLKEFTENKQSKSITPASDMFQSAIKEQKTKKYSPEEYNKKNYESPEYYESSPSLSLASISKSLQSELSSMRSSLRSSVKSSSSSGGSSVLSYSDISSAVSEINRGVSGSSSTSKSSKSSSTSSKSSGGSSKGSSISLPSSISDIFIPPKFYQQKQPLQNKKKSLGTGYWIYIKQIKSNNFIKANDTPVTNERAKDIGNFLVDTSVARTFLIKKAGQSAQEDYKFVYIPYGYYQSNKGKLRNYRVKNKNPYDLDMERYIEKQKYVGDTRSEIKQLQSFQRQVQNIMR